MVRGARACFSKPRAHLVVALSRTEPGLHNTCGQALLPAGSSDRDDVVHLKALARLLQVAEIVLELLAVDLAPPPALLRGGGSDPLHLGPAEVVIVKGLKDKVLLGKQDVVETAGLGARFERELDVAQLVQAARDALLVDVAGHNGDEIAALERDVSRVRAGARIALDGVVLGEEAGLERVGGGLHGRHLEPVLFEDPPGKLVEVVAVKAGDGLENLAHPLLPMDVALESGAHPLAALVPAVHEEELPRLDPW